MADLDYQTPKLSLQALRSLIRLLPRGRNHILSRFANYANEKSNHLVSTEYGFKNIVSIKDQIGRDIFFHGVYEPVTAAIIEHLLQPGDTFIDVGANIGFFTLLAAKSVAPDGRVYAFEPSSKIRGMLNASLNNNLYKNITVEDKACTETSGKFNLIEGNSAELGGTKVTDEAIDGNELVNGVSLDEYILSNKILSIDLLKMDIEGGEDAALKGMKQTLADGIIENLIVEFHPHCGLVEGWPRTKELVAMIANFGYSYKQIREHSPLLGEHYKCKFSENLFYNTNQQGQSMREVATPQYLFQKTM